VIDYVTIPEQNNGLTGSSDWSRQHSWTKHLTDWFKWWIASIFLNKTMDWLVQVIDNVNIPEHKMDWLVKVTIHINVTEHTMDWLAKVADHTNIPINKRTGRFKWPFTLLHRALHNTLREYKHLW
jgi:hypothetical protein